MSESLDLRLTPGQIRTLLGLCRSRETVLRDGLDNETLEDEPYGRELGELARLASLLERTAAEGGHAM